ncbi:TPA: hypothetical protein ACJTOQ_002602 [Klebsiella pneumoniae]
MSKIDIIKLATSIAKTKDFSVLDISIISDEDRLNIKTLAEGIIMMAE